MTYRHRELEMFKFIHKSIKIYLFDLIAFQESFSLRIPKIFQLQHKIINHKSMNIYLLFIVNELNQISDI